MQTLGLTRVIKYIKHQRWFELIVIIGGDWRAYAYTELGIFSARHLWKLNYSDRSSQLFGFSSCSRISDYLSWICT